MKNSISSALSKVPTNTGSKMAFSLPEEFNVNVTQIKEPNSIELTCLSFRN